MSRETRPKDATTSKEDDSIMMSGWPATKALFAASLVCLVVVSGIAAFGPVDKPSSGDESHQISQPPVDKPSNKSSSDDESHRIKCSASVTREWGKLAGKALFLHMAKAGGGTIYRDRMERIWRLKLSQCHPHPCPSKQYRNKKLLIALRDPADRFISAFYWKIKEYTDPDTKKKKNFNHPEVEVVFRTYGKDVNRLLRALCSANKTMSKSAKQDVRKIKHLREDIVDWLTPDLFLSHADNVYPIVMESAVPSIVSQTDEAVEWLHNQTQFEPDFMFFQRQEMVHAYDACSESPDESSKWVHSSGASNTVRFSPEYEKCLVQFYRRDYEALAEVKVSMCKTEACERGIQSILDRRASLLSNRNPDAQGVWL